MPLPVIISLIIIGAAVGVLIILKFTVFDKIRANREKQNEAMEEAKKTITVLVIDKKKMKMADSGLPKVILENAPKRALRRNMPIVKVKYGPRIMSLVCDANIFNDIPVKTTIQAQVSGIYMVGFNLTKTSKTNNTASSDPAPKKKFFFF